MIYTSYSSPFYQFVDAVFRRRWMLIVPAVVTTATILAAIQMGPKSYVAQKAMLVQSPSKLSHMVEELGGNSRPDQRQPKIVALEALADSRAFINDAVKRSGVDLGRDEKRAEKLLQLRRGLTTSLNDDSTVVMVSLKWPEKEQAEKLLDAVVETYIRRVSEFQTAEASTASVFLRQQEEQLRQKVATAEQKRGQFRAAHWQELMSGSDSAGTRLGSLNSLLGDTRVKRSEVEMRVAMLAQKLQTTPKEIAIEREPERPQRDPLETRIQEMEIEMASLLNQYTEEHPKVVALKQQLTVAKQRFAENQAKIPPPVELPTSKPNPDYLELEKSQREAQIALQGLKGAEVATQQQLSQFVGQAKGMPQAEVTMAALDRDYEVYKKIYDSVVEKLAAARMAEQMAVQKHRQSLQVIDGAEAEPSLSGAKKIAMIAFAPLLGLLLGAACVLLAEQLDHSLRGETDVERFLAKPVLATVPLGRGSRAMQTALPGPSTLDQLPGN